MPLVDFHTHLPLRDEIKNKLLRSMDLLDIESSVVVSGGVISCQLLSEQMNFGGGKDVCPDNMALLEFCSDEKRLLPFYFANPHSDTKEYEKYGSYFHGLKLGPAVHGVPLLDEKNLKFIQLAECKGQTVYLHCLARQGFDILSLVKLAQRFENVNFVLGHAGVGQCDFFAVDKIAPISNIYFETSGGFTSVLKYALLQLGEQRMLFGSEFPLEEPDVEINKLKYLEVATSQLGKNAYHLLKVRKI